VIEERRRVARDLHDGLAHELALISRQSKRLLARYDAELVSGIAAAAGRALAESRRAISTLASSPERELRSALADASREAAAGYGARVVLEVDREFDLPPDLGEELVRIAAEAVANAGRHGRASVVRVELTNGAVRRLRVRDNGVGFDPADPTGFGIAIMRERARAIGGELRLSSAPGGGTEIEVVLP
jgi:signal transduction histidine kinase